MILKAERTKLKKILQNRWIDEVLNKLREEKILNKQGNEFEKTYISHVFNGRNSNIDIEKAIFQVALEQKNKLAKMRAERKEKLNK